jgi:hypothetical protein
VNGGLLRLTPRVGASTLRRMSHRTRVNLSRTVLVMLLVAALVVLGLGVFFYLRGDATAPDVEGWLRTLFGKVFLVVAIGLAAVLGVPSAIGLYAMAGANREDAVPALPQPARVGLVALAIGTTVVTAIVLLVTGSMVRILNLGLLGIVALGTLGLAGAVAFSPHRWRAILAAIALVVFVLGTAWLLVNAFISPPVP